MTVKKIYYCDVCKKKIKQSFPGMELYWNNAQVYMARKTLHLKHVCYNCTEIINDMMDPIYVILKEQEASSDG